jgi:hypothetical protein
METPNTKSAADSPLLHLDLVRQHLLETAKWGRFLAITGYVILVLIGLGAVSVAFFALLSDSFNGFPTQVMLLVILYAVLGAIYFFPVYYLHQYATRIHEGLGTNDAAMMTEAFGNLKSLFKFFGIMTIITICVYGLLILVMGSVYFLR